MDQITRIIAGFDGSAESRGAVRWAAGRALALAKQLTVVGVVGPSSAHPDAAIGRGRVAAEGEVGHLVWGLRSEFPALSASEMVLTGSPAAQLIELSNPQTMLVVATRGVGGVMGRVVGSVAEAVAEHATGPVVAVPRSIDGDLGEGSIVVGIDPGEGSSGALDFAIGAAHAEGRHLIQVTAHEPVAFDPAAPIGVMALREAADRDPRTAGVDDGQVRRFDGRADRAILSQGDDSCTLIVVGRRGSGGYPSMGLGSTARRVLREAEIPVALIS